MNEPKTGIEVIEEYCGGDSEKLKNFRANAFEKIEKLFFNRNFGSAQKSEIELLMFSIYMEMMIDCNCDEDGVLDYAVCSDRNIGAALGISPETARRLKTKKQARYPHLFDWKKALMKLKDNIRYDEASKKIIIPTPDPNLHDEIQNVIENSGGYIEATVSKKCISIRPEYYIMLFAEDMDDKRKNDKLLNDAAKLLNKKNAGNNASFTNNKELLAALLDFGGNIIEIVNNLAPLLNAPQIAVKALTGAVKKIAAQ